MITTTIFVGMWIFGPGTTIIHWVGARIEIVRQERMIRQLQIDNAELDKKINMLRNDRDTLEKFAREQFHFAAPGDDVYLLEED